MNWLGRLLRRRTLEAQLEAELRDHFERLVGDYRRQGLAEAEARRRARLDFGGLDQVKESCRDVRGTRWLEELGQDLRYGGRSLRRHLGFTIVAVLTLALGGAATMTIFNLVEALLLRTLPVPNAGDLVSLTRIQDGSRSEHFSYPQVQLLADRSDLFAEVAGIGSDTVNVGPPESLEPTSAAWVNGGYFPTLGLMPLAGRLLTAADDRPGAAPAAVITHDYWMRRFGGDPATVGAQLRIEGMNVPIVGITPRGFTGATVGEHASITLAVAARPLLQPENKSSVDASARWLRVLGRPSRGVDLEQLQRAIDAAWPEVLAATLPSGINAETRARSLRMRLSVQGGAQGTSRIRDRFRTPLMAAMAIVILVLLIACANVANLLLARAAARSREIAVRLAIGAGRSRIVRQLLTESAMLAAVGATAAITLGIAGSQALVTLIATGQGGPDASQLSLDLSLNWRVCAAALALMAATTLLFGLLPAWRAARPGPLALSSASAVIYSQARLARSVIVAQVALSLAVMTAAGIFARSLHNLRAVDRGFRTNDVLLVSFDPTRMRMQPGELRDFNRSVLRIVEDLPGIHAATVAAVTPLQGGGMSVPMFVNGVSTGQEEVYFNVIGPRFFQIMRTPLLAGRDLNAADDATAPGAAVVNEAFVRRYFRDGNGLGQRVSLAATADEMQIVGVVGNAVYETLRVAPPPTVYMSYLQGRERRMTLVIDVAGPVGVAAAAVRAAVQPKVPTQPVRVRTLAAQVEGSLVRERVMALLTTVFAALALALAGVGLYGLVSHSVTSRTREIGVRLALGADHRAIARWVLEDAIRLVGLGLLGGIPTAWLLSRLVRALMFGVSPADPAAMAAGMVVLIIVGITAAAVPARRAARIDPVLSLRSD
jgi:predicted permease